MISQQFDHFPGSTVYSISACHIGTRVRSKCISCNMAGVHSSQGKEFRDLFQNPKKLNTNEDDRMKLSNHSVKTYIFMDTLINGLFQI